MQLKLLFLLSSFFINSYCAWISDDDLFHMILNGDIRNILKYLNEGGDVNRIIYSQSLLCRAAIHEKFDIVELLIMRGASVNLRHGGWSPLHHAAYHGYTKIVQLLIKHGAIVDEHIIEDLKNRHISRKIRKLLGVKETCVIL